MLAVAFDENCKKISQQIGLLLKIEGQSPGAHGYIIQGSSMLTKFSLYPREIN
jgi:hypothetical protein